ncbi:MAG: LPPG:FO 2-phospho-L-lactate transferase [Halieaceae bacterium]|jgi:LPPG:FO 2-phospho-L-lactate transferase
MANDGQILALTGGVGGAKLCLGLASLVAGDRLKIVVNTADDFVHLGLSISPDIDTLLYTLSGRSNAEQGWGLADESWHTLGALEELGSDTWFQLGDKDIATHLWRGEALAEGMNLTTLTGKLAAKWGIDAEILPMTNQQVRTIVQTVEGEMPFQHYFVKYRCQPAVTGFNFSGLNSAQPNPRLIELLASNALSAVVICPSNPFVSVDPILQLPGLWPLLRDCAAPVFAVSPIVAGMAVKGPTAKMMAELELPVTALGVAEHYHEHYPELIDYFILDESDATLSLEIEKLGMNVSATATVMTTLEDKQKLATTLLTLAGHR